MKPRTHGAERALEWADGSRVYDRDGCSIRTGDVVTWAGSGHVSGARGKVLRLLDASTVRVMWIGDHIGDVHSGLLRVVTDHA